jgi:hypothetical protein
VPKLFARSRVDRVVDVSARDAEETAAIWPVQRAVHGRAAWAALQVARGIETGCIVFIAHRLRPWQPISEQRSVQV